MTPSTTPYKRGDIVLVSFPFTDLSSVKRRPALVISPDVLNRRNQDLILAAITSQLTEAPFTLRIGSGDFADGALPKESQIRLTKLFTLNSSLVHSRLCTLRTEKLDVVLAELRRLYS